MNLKINKNQKQNMSDKIDNIITKQLIINKLPIPFYIQELLEEFVFLDKIQSKVKNNFKNIIDIFNKSYYGFRPNFPDYSINTFSSWFIKLPKIEFNSVNCRKCGNFVFFPRVYTEFEFMFYNRQNIERYNEKITCNCTNQRDNITDFSFLYGGNLNMK